MRKSLYLFPIIVCLAFAASAQTTAFTYQGSLTNAAVPANGTYLMEFRLFDALTGGTQIGSTVSNPSVPVTSGRFTVSLDFGVGAFVTGADRYLQISVKANAGDSFTLLGPRNRLTSSPFAVRSVSAANSDLFGGQPPATFGTSAQVTALQNQIAALQAELAQTTGGDHIWSRKFGGSGVDQALGVDIDNAGNIFITGSFTNTINFGGTNLVPVGGSDIFLVKLSGSTGAHMWSTSFGGTAASTGRSIAVDGNGDVVLTGSFAGQIDFGGGPLTSAGQSDIFVTKLSGANGSHVWSRRFGSTSVDDGVSVATDPLGDVLLTGNFFGSVNFGGSTLSGGGNFDFFAAKYTGSTGAHVWSKAFGGSGIDLSRGIAADSNGNVFLTGDFASAVIDLGAGPVMNAGITDVFLIKFASGDGSHLWSKRIGSFGNDAATGVATDSSGNVFLTGTFNFPIDLGGGPISTAGDLDVFAAKFEPAGIHQWSKSFGGPTADQSTALAVDTAGNLLITGTFAATAGFGGPLLNTAGGVDIFLAKCSAANGSSLWSRRYGNTTSEISRAISVDANGDVYLTGGFGPATLDFGGGPLTGFDANDIFVAKLRR